MTRRQAMYWGDNDFMHPESLWERIFGVDPLKRLFHPCIGTKMRLTLDGPDLETYYNTEGALCVLDPDTNEEVIAIYG